MIRAYSVEHVRAAEDVLREVLRHEGAAEGELMRRAAAGLAAVVAARAVQHRWRSVVVLAGPGDNGGDALHLAALLAGAPEGPAVAVVGVADRLHAGGAQAVAEAGLPLARLDPHRGELGEEVLSLLTEADAVVDGLLGIGGRPGLRDTMAALAEAVPSTAFVLAVDLPSGADPAGEEPISVALEADETLTVGVAKPVHLLPATRAAVGVLTVVDIGLEVPDDPVVERLEHSDVGGLWPVPGPSDDKYSRGVLGVVAGSDRYPGAAVLSCAAAVEAGAGMVRYVGPPEATRAVLAACPEVVPGQGRVQAWVVGPGLSDAEPDAEEGRRQVEAARAALREHVPVLVDAGGLDLLTAALLDQRRGRPTLLTPHAGEAARLLTRLVDGEECTRAEVEARPLWHARRLADATGCTVLLKGSVTLVVPPGDGAVRSQADGSPWLATAGAGDVLSGLAGVLLAAGRSPLDAGALAALVHGRAAALANPGGPVRALSLAHALPRVLAEMIAR